MAGETRFGVRERTESEMRRVSMMAAVIYLVFAMANVALQLSMRDWLPHPNAHLGLGIASTALGLAALGLGRLAGGATLRRLWPLGVWALLAFAVSGLTGNMLLTHYPQSGIAAIGYPIIAILAFYLLTRWMAVVVITALVVGQGIVEVVSDSPWPLWFGTLFVASSLGAAGYLTVTLIEQIEAGRRLIRRYVPSAVAARIDSGDDAAVGVPQRLRVTVLSSDVAGFTVMADRLDPESLSQIINEYVAVMSEVVEGQGGVVTEFAGDGLTAIFGAPEEAEPVDQVRQAVAAAKSMHQRLADLNEAWFHLGIEQPLRVRIGINTGVLSVGTFGSAGRGTYTAIGLQMNVAARIQAQCEPGSTLLSSSSWHLVKDEVHCESLGEVTVKGVHFPISVYAPSQP